VSQKLATRAYRAVVRVAVGHAKRVRFKGKHQLDTGEGKSNETGLVWRSDRVVWRGLTLPAYLPRRALRDPVLAHGLTAPVKCVRLVRRRMGEQRCFWVQLICEGTAYHHPPHSRGEGAVGLDLGPSTLAMVSRTRLLGWSHCVPTWTRRRPRSGGTSGISIDNVVPITLLTTPHG